MSDYLFLAAAFSALGALARIAGLYLAGTSLSLAAVAANLTISAFAAALAYLVALWLGWKLPGTGVACGLAAWLGVDFLNELGRRFLERFRDKEQSK